MHLHILFYRLRRRLRQCYEDLFIDTCGKLAGRTMSRLIFGMFYDPQFWHFGFRYYKNTEHTSENRIGLKLFCNDIEVQRRNYTTGKGHREIPTKEKSMTIASPIKVTTTAGTKKASQKETIADIEASFIYPNYSLSDADATIDASHRSLRIKPTQSSSTKVEHIEPTFDVLPDKMGRINTANIPSERAISYNQGYENVRGELGAIKGSSDEQGHSKGQHVTGSPDDQSHDRKRDMPQRDQDKIPDSDQNKNNNDSTTQQGDEFKDVDFIMRTEIKNKQHYEEKKRKNRRGNSEVVLQKDAELSGFHDENDDEGSMVHAPSKDEFSSKYNGVDHPINAHASHSSGSPIRPNIKSVSHFTILLLILQIVFFV